MVYVRSFNEIWFPFSNSVASSNTGGSPYGPTELDDQNFPVPYLAKTAFLFAMRTSIDGTPHPVLLFKENEATWEVTALRNSANVALLGAKAVGEVSYKVPSAAAMTFPPDGPTRSAEHEIKTGASLSSAAFLRRGVIPDVSEELLLLEHAVSDVMETIKSRQIVLIFLVFTHVLLR